MPPPPRRKKWTEAEEKTLIDKYGEMVCDGSLAKMKTRERKHKPIASYVNSVHHDCDPVAFPWQWTWKDVSTKVQNMRHQYSLVKQKIKKHDLGGDPGLEEFDWVDGLTHWSNFLRYKEVFGDLPVGNDSMMAAGEDNNGNGNEGFDGSGNGMDVVLFGHLGHHGDGDFVSGFDGGENGVMGLDFEYDGEEGDDNNHNTSMNHLKQDGDEGFVCEDVEPSGSDTRRKRKVLKGMGKRAWGFISDQLGQLREMESRFERRDMERERERQRKEQLRDEMEREREKRREEWEKEREARDDARDKLRRQRIREWEAMEEESEERERRRREDQMIYEREREERMSRRRSDWNKRIDDMLSQHRVELGQIQNRILHEQQNLTGQMLGIVSQWTGHPTGLSDPTGASNHYLSQMMQNLHHVNGIVHGDNRVDGDNQEDQFIVDG